MSKPLTITPSSKPIKAYYSTLRELKAQDVDHEQAVRSAFQTLLTDLARPQKWTAIPELGKKVRTHGKKTRVIPDGTLRDRFQLPRGYWEAKDSADNLTAEINSKIKLGYPLDNTIFWTPAVAILFQGGQQVHKASISEAGDEPNLFCDLLTAFFTYVDKPLVDFDDAVETFTDRVPAVGAELAKIIAEAHKSHKKFKDAFTAFFELCRTTLNPNISQQAVDEMLVQHLLTKRLFRSIFKNSEFLQKNVIASEVEKVITALSSKHFNPEQFLASLDHFYVAIENAAERVHDWSSKQHFLNTVYERFFQGYCIKTADTHGIVYTPQPIVDFMCASVEWVLETEFGKKLGDDGVNILDPCTGTGNFVVNLMKRAAERGPKYLKRMYTEQLFANEIMLMPYYIAAMNIEHEFFEQTGEYEAFEGLCFVDTLDLAEAKTMGLFTEANLARVERQKRTPITVVIGNPPYNVGQEDENDNNKNRPHNVIDRRVSDTYAKASLSTNRNALSDAYVKFFRWASDRLSGRDGIVCFVTNNGFLDQRAFDGMRKHLARDFQLILHIDLHGNVRRNPKLSGTKHNVFGIQTGVGITVAVRRTKLSRNGVLLNRAPENWDKEHKLSWLAGTRPDEVVWKQVPDALVPWIGAGNESRFASLMALGIRSRDSAARSGRSVFHTMTIGVKTNRDEVAYDFDSASLEQKIRDFINSFTAELDRYHRSDKKTPVDTFVNHDRLKWSRDLKQDLLRGRSPEFDREKIRPSLYRPFSKRMVFLDPIVNEEVYGIPSVFPGSAFEAPNELICCTNHLQATFALQISSIVPNEAVGGRNGQCFPFYTYDEDGTNRRENITDWALNLFRSHFTTVSPAAAAKAKKLTKWDIFHYVYAILHHQGYRDTFADNLKRELPRIPLVKSFADFESFVAAGEKLAKLHLNYDDEKVIKPYKLREDWTLTDSEGRKRHKSWRVEDKMRLNKEKTSLTVNETLTLHDIPADVYRYRLGNRSALEWVIDQYQVYTDPKTQITSDANAWGEERNDPEYIVRLVKQVVTVSLETMKLVDALPKDFGGPPAASTDSSPSDPDPAPEPAPSNKRHSMRVDGPNKQGRLRS